MTQVKHNGGGADKWNPAVGPNTIHGSLQENSKSRTLMLGNGCEKKREEVKKEAQCIMRSSQESGTVTV